MSRCHIFKLGLKNLELLDAAWYVASPQTRMQCYKIQKQKE